MKWPFHWRPAKDLDPEEAAEIVELHSARVHGEELLERLTKTIDELDVISDAKPDNS